MDQSGAQYVAQHTTEYKMYVLGLIMNFLEEKHSQSCLAPWKSESLFWINEQWIFWWLVSIDQNGTQHVAQHKI